MKVKNIYPIKSMEELRAIAADYMKEHPDEFLPFLVHEDEDFSYTQGKSCIIFAIYTLLTR
jgi:hypothetical protein